MLVFRTDKHWYFPNMVSFPLTLVLHGHISFGKLQQVTTWQYKRKKDESETNSKHFIINNSLVKYRGYYSEYPVWKINKKKKKKYWMNKVLVWKLNGDNCTCCWLCKYSRLVFHMNMQIHGKNKII